ncbi:MAG: polymer-forming cytoskeletal protein [Sphingobacteriales bacterium]|nr:polymer-forming cytoskeletal protein [Sphingobacteriales bacterium]
MSSNPASAANRNLISKGTNIEGTITSDGAIRIEGTFLGKLDSKSKVIIGDSGYIKGDIICESVDIEGTYEGTLNASGILTLKSTANVKGDLTYGKLVIEPGAIFNGTCNMNDKSSNTYNTTPLAANS